MVKIMNCLNLTLEETETLEEDEFEDEDGRTATEESNPPDRPRKISAVPAPNIIHGTAVSP